MTNVRSVAHIFHRMINDHEPPPLNYDMNAEVEEFDAGGCSVERRGINKHVATLPKKRTGPSQFE
jgi:uncharacterized protein (DUF2249 family)